VPSRSAAVVQQLLDAGAIFAGKTNLDQFATGLVGTRSPLGGPCRNPFDPALVAGGSSSGSAIVVATGEVVCALGTDTAGSGRVPAALCGIVGVKPTPGALPTTGIVPAMPSFDCVSVFASSTADAAAVLDVVHPHRGAPVRALRRLGVPRPIDFHGDDDARACFDLALARLVGLGCELVDVTAEPLRRAGALVYGSALVAERAASFGAVARAHPDAMDPAVLAIVQGAEAHTAVDFARDLAALGALRAAVEGAWWTDVDALVLPTVARVPGFEESLRDRFGPSAELGELTAFVNPLGLAAVALPAGRRAGGVPFGVSLVGPGGSDRALLALASRFAFDDDDGGVGDGVGLVDPFLTHRIAVVGAHLSGEPLNHQLTDRGAVRCASTTTAPAYRLYALDTTPPKPGLVRTPTGGGALEVEVWALDAAAFADFVTAIPAPLGVGRVELADGSEVTGFLCEPYAVEHARDITAYGGWRAYVHGEG
jgi:allophanate hydrolase